MVRWLVAVPVVWMTMVSMDDCVAVASGAPVEFIHQIEAFEPMPERAVATDGFTLNTGLGMVHLGEGILVPASQVAGRSVEYAFVGDGRVVMRPEDEVEAGQLEVFLLLYLDAKIRNGHDIAVDKQSQLAGKLTCKRVEALLQPGRWQCPERVVLGCVRGIVGV